MRKIALCVFGVILALLGGLWLLQGLGVVNIEPVACVAACERLEGPSAGWAAVGTVVLLAGVLTVFYALRRVGR